MSSYESGLCTHYVSLDYVLNYKLKPKQPRYILTSLLAPTMRRYIQDQFLKTPEIAVEDYNIVTIH